LWISQDDAIEETDIEISKRLPSRIIHIDLNLPFTRSVSDGLEGHVPVIDFWKANRRGAVRHQGSVHQEYAVNGKHRLAAPDKCKIEAGLTDIGLMQRIQHTGVEEQCIAEAGAVRVSATLYPYLGLLA
jgi:hypothetical protein